MTKQEIDKIFETGEEGRFIQLIVPALGEFPQIDLSGKKKLELSLDEVVRVKKYAAKLYQSMQ